VTFWLQIAIWVCLIKQSNGIKRFTTNHRNIKIFLEGQYKKGCEKILNDKLNNFIVHKKVTLSLEK
jgi:hypothetical protein